MTKEESLAFLEATVERIRNMSQEDFETRCLECDFTGKLFSESEKERNGQN
jgi:hypothetical protein